MRASISNKLLHAFYCLLTLLVFSVFYYCVEPKYCDFSINVFYINIFIFIVGTIVYFKNARKTNYFDFDTIFVCVYFFVGYFTTFYYGLDIYPYLFLHFPFNEQYINSSLWLFTIGILSYYIGRLVNVTNNKNTELSKTTVINTDGCMLVLVALFLVYIMLGGFNRYVGIYLNGETGDGGIVVQIEILITSFIYAIVATELYNKKISPLYKIKKIPVIIVLAMICLLLFAGNRTLPSYFILSTLGLYALLFRPINLRMMCIIMLIGIVGMWAVGIHRSGTDISVQQNAAMYAVDMTINTRNTYVAMEYVEQHGFTYGKTMLYGILGVIPFLSTLLGINKNEIGSAEVLTQYTYSNMDMKRDFIGLGTNIIADIYLSFGVIGVIVLMLLLGIFIAKCTKSALKINYYSIVIYSVVISMSVFGIRTGYTHIFRMLVWTLLIAYFNKYFTLSSCRKR